ncbi:insulinase family protein [Vibrio sp. DNF-1]|nr:pitrilysin family protein [Vibrio salinus]MCE0494217.1 insulinase family protein [Vibrio salinus]
MRWLYISVLTLIVVACSSTGKQANRVSLPAGVTLTEKHQPTLGEVGIPYSKYRLSNGLTIILAPDHSDPLVKVDVTYHVGSSREEPGYTGFAHFFEHMMFQGSKHVGDQQHFRMITEAGGTLNGSTNRDRTNYYEMVPSNQLEKVLWLESDRMGFLLDAVSQRKFEIQRDTVKNERAQNYDDRPYGLIWEKMDQAMFPPTHPYSWQPIGYVDDLDRVSVKDLKAFFLRWYGPNNAVLTIGGDIDVGQTLKWVKKYFGPIPKGPDVTRIAKEPVSLSHDRYITVEDRIKQPMVVIGWPTEYLGAPSEISLDVLARVIGGGSNSLLYQKLVKTQKALDAGSFQKCGELSCRFYLYAMTSSLQPGKLKQLKDTMLSVVGQLYKSGIHASRLKEIKGMAQADAVFALESVSGKVAQLASNQIYFNQPDRLQQELAELDNVTERSVRDVLQHFLLSRHKVVMSVVPQGHPELAVTKQNYTFHRAPVVEKNQLETQTLKYRKPRDTFDRSRVPAVVKSVMPSVPRLYNDYLDNGVEIMGTETTETPTVLIQISVPAGNRYVPSGKEGLAGITADLLSEGTTLHSSEEIESRLDKLGSVISVSSGMYTSKIVVSSLKSHLDETLTTLNEILNNPQFSIHDFNRIKHQRIQEALYRHEKSGWLASQATRQILYDHTIFARSPDGTPGSLKGITLKEVKAFFASHYTPNGAQVSVVGDISEREAMQKLQFLNHWKGLPAPLLVPQSLIPLKGQSIYLINKPGSSQSIVRFVRQGMKFDATGEMFMTQLANFNLAGNFNSRMNQNLREDKGITYGMSGYIASNREVGAIIFNASVKQEATLEAIREIKSEMLRYSQEGITDSELQFMRLAVGQQDALEYETPAQKAQLIGGIMTYSLDPDYLSERNQIVADISKATINTLIRKWFNPEDYQIIVVGDANKLKPQLEKLNLPVVELEI